jgi:hypothetical protein
MKSLKLLFITINLAICLQSVAGQVSVSSSIFNAQKMPFLPHVGSGAFDNYLSMNIPYHPAKKVFEQLVRMEKMPLKNRGEAHITVITPVEYWQVLKPQGVGIEEINDIASKNMIQQAAFQVSCVGRGSAEVSGKQEHTYYLVVTSEELLKIREQVQLLFQQKGGDPKKFSPANFYPHITLGFSQRDLHESDGVIKDIKSCRHEIVITN